MNLLITEKPSVATSISQVIGAKKKDAYYEGNGFIITWCLGHLVKLAEAEAYGDYKQWKIEDLPIIPSEWKTSIIEEKKDQFNVVSNLMNSSAVDEIICATDAGREGELIFRLVYDKAGCKKPVKRLWISSMEDSAIKEGLQNMKDASSFDNLYEAAIARAKSDWLIGINASRLYSITYHKNLRIGRVQSPTLKMIVDRDEKIKNFKSKSFYTITLDLGFPAVSDRIEDCKAAESQLIRCTDVPAVVESVERENGKINPPQLFDLTTLQRTANRLFGYSAKEVMDTSQALYEKKLITYPRTDSRFITASQRGKVQKLLESVRTILPFQYEYEESDIANIINDDKVSDHHALLPTERCQDIAISDLSGKEQVLLYLIASQLVYSVCKPETHVRTDIELSVNKFRFTTQNTSVVSGGWKDLELKMLQHLKPSADIDKNTDFSFSSDISVGDFLEQKQEPSMKEGKTSPPLHFTEDTLLSAMERASEDDFKKIENPERTGLGTPATRASVIEQLIKSRYIERKNKSLVATDDGIMLASKLPVMLKSPKYTADMEGYLSEIALGKRNPSDYSNLMNYFAKTLVNIELDAEDSFRKDKVVGKCPICGADVIERQKGFHCSNKECGFSIWKNDLFFTSKGKNLTGKMLSRLLAGEEVLCKGLLSAKGTKYDAKISMILPQDKTEKYPRWNMTFCPRKNK